MRLLLILTIALAITYVQLRASDFELASKLIKQHEGYVSKPYIDKSSFSIGYGINLINGLTEPEALLLLNHRLAIRKQQLINHRWFRNQSEARRAVLLDLSYNIGYKGILGFKKMIWALNHGYYNGAANEMKNSLWYHQTGNRARRLVKIMRKGIL